mmetsp:Transcript_6732/g.9776  ORF Transcript_6732/g.9776 Transcript_6732/m.9776 type:complete len:504 (+) Transcript_6732:3-1514(+)
MNNSSSADNVESEVVEEEKLDNSEESLGLGNNMFVFQSGDKRNGLCLSSPNKTELPASSSIMKLHHQISVVSSLWSNSSNSSRSASDAAASEATAVSSITGRNDDSEHLKLRKRPHDVETQTNFSLSGPVERLSKKGKKNDSQMVNGVFTSNAGSVIEKGDCLTSSNALLSNSLAISAKHPATTRNSGHLSSASSSSSSDSFGCIVNTQMERLSLPILQREKRNICEKNRSLRITQQIDQIRSVLLSGGVTITKLTKSFVLTKAAEYIVTLQRNQARSEIERQKLIRKFQMIESGALGSTAALAARQAAAQNGFWEQGNFKESSVYYADSHEKGVDITATVPEDFQQAYIKEHEYQQVFQFASVPMAIASVNGEFVDGNHLFCSLSEYSKQDLCSMTIFNIIARSELQNAFDKINSLMASKEGLSQSVEPKKQSHVVLRGKMKNSRRMGVSIAIIQQQNQMPKCILVVLLDEASAKAEEQPPLLISFNCANNIFLQKNQEVKL